MRIRSAIRRSCSSSAFAANPFAGNWCFRSHPNLAQTAMGACPRRRRYPSCQLRSQSEPVIDRQSGSPSSAPKQPGWFPAWRILENMVHTFEVDLNGRKITLETGKMAKQANGAVVVRSGDSVVLVTACANVEPKPGAAFFPLTVDYREYTYAAGKIPGGFIKREGRMSEKETLTSRLIDRPVRPLFPEGFSCETQIIAMVVSADPEQDPDKLAIVGAGAALAISDIPFVHVLGAVRVGLINGVLVANPAYSESRESALNIVVAATEGGIVMVEAAATQVSEAQVLEAIEFGHDCCRQIAAGIWTSAA